MRRTVSRQQAHILVVRDIALPELRTLLATRSYHPLFAYPAQHVSVYQVDALGTDDIACITTQVTLAGLLLSLQGPEGHAYTRR